MARGCCLEVLLLLRALDLRFCSVIQKLHQEDTVVNTIERLTKVRENGLHITRFVLIFVGCLYNVNSCKTVDLFFRNPCCDLYSYNLLKITRFIIFETIQRRETGLKFSMSLLLSFL